MLNEIRATHQTNQESGFTLIEVMVVIVIMSILSAIGVATFTGVQEAGWKATVKSDVRNTVTNIAAFVASQSGAPFVDDANLTVSEGNCLVVSGSFRDYVVEGSNYAIENWGLHFDATKGSYVERDYPVCTTEGATPEPAPVEPETETPEAEGDPATPNSGAPTGLTATTSSGNRSLSLAWNPVPEATNYTVSYDLCIRGNDCHEGAAETSATAYTINSSSFGNNGPITAYSVAVTSDAGTAGEASTVVKGNINH